MPRKTRIATIGQCGRFGRSIDESVAMMLQALEPVWPQEPDIVCLPENFATAGLAVPTEDKAQPVPGPVTDAFAEQAARYGCYVICALTTRQPAGIFNSAVVLDRNGAVAGRYDKVQPVTSTWDYTSLERGITPGAEADVIALDCGRIGIQICFDIEFPETWRALEERGAEVVFWPSAYDGGFPLAAYAYLHGYYVVSSVRSTHARIIDPLGRELAATSQRLPWVVHTVDLDYIVLHHDYHHRVPAELSRAYGRDVTVHQLAEEGRILIESNRDDLPLAEIVERFGLVARREYIERHRIAYRERLSGRPATPQTPAFAGRLPYTDMTLAEWERTRRHHHGGAEPRST